MSEWTLVSDIDFAFDLESETFSECLAKLSVEVPSAFVKILNLEGPGGGWPNCDVIVKSEDLDKFWKFFGCDEDDIEWMSEYISPLN